MLLFHGLHSPVLQNSLPLSYRPLPSGNPVVAFGGPILGYFGTSAGTGKTNHPENGAQMSGELLQSSYSRVLPLKYFLPLLNKQINVYLLIFQLSSH